MTPIEQNRNYKNLHLLLRGMTPIEKSIIVTDVNGNTIGSTFPKRAKGLVKNGRAEYVSDCKIRLLFTHALTVTDDITEDLNMSKVINFNARDYKTDFSCTDNTCERMFLSTSTGITEVWEIGDISGNCSQIFCEKKLDTNTDYILRFAVSDKSDSDNSAKSLVWIYHTDGYENTEAAWEDRFTFPLNNNLFEPILCKKDKIGIIRIFELPFNTGDFSDWRFVFSSQNVVSRFFTAGSNESYSAMEDAVIDTIQNTDNNSKSDKSSFFDFENSDESVSFKILNLSDKEQVGSVLTELAKLSETGAEINIKSYPLSV